MLRAWYREGVVYQIYPRSFRDADGDGIGDLSGIIEKIPHIAELGANIVWLSPVYASPNDDNGYDISDYRDDQPGIRHDGRHGRADRQASTGRGIKLVMDLVVNHTSDEHPWFQKSVQKATRMARTSTTGPRKRRTGPRSSASRPGPSIRRRKEWYLHLFSKKQPDLNWDHPRVQEEVKGILEFWLAKGVDGFRCDVINLLGKADGLPMRQAAADPAPDASTT
ncbi:MAG: alpha-amylase family glycosyl hydrolase [Comamonadaceae bacterium]|nr:alpha-amylase family glycosyl hydrolase [Comamonadaceae bacterium]